MCVPVYVCVCVLLSYADYSQNRAQGADVKKYNVICFVRLVAECCEWGGGGRVYSVLNALRICVCVCVCGTT